MLSVERGGRLIDLPTAQQALADIELLEAAKRARPSLFYHPAPHQEAFHRSRHAIRILALGNRGGKTFAGGMECNWILNGGHPYQPSLKAPVMGAWICGDYSQFRELAARELEPKVWDAGWVWQEDKQRYRWPNGSTLRVISTERNWKFIQGLNWDFMHFDEGFPYALWLEASMRRFGDRDCRYTMTLTDTNSQSAWLREVFYLPWLRHHADAGLQVSEGHEDAAMLAQTHPDIFLWPKGGIADNPHATAKNIEWYQRQNFASEEDKRTRLGGGFRRMGGNLVFDAEGVAACSAEIVKQAPAAPASLKLKGIEKPIWQLEVGAIKADQIVYDTLPDRCYELRVWKPPVKGRQYVIGADFAQGIEGGDRDTACVLDLTAGDDTKPYEQVAEVSGHLGVTFSPLLLALCLWYNRAYLVGENQGGGADALGLMWLHGGYKRMYVRRAEDSAAQTVAANPRLGYAPKTGVEDPAMNVARRWVKAKRVLIRSPQLVSELGDYVLEKPDPSSPDYTPDSDMIMKLKTGKSPDPIKAFAYAVFGCGHATKFIEPDPGWSPGSYGQLLNLPRPAKSAPSSPRSGWIAPS